MKTHFVTLYQIKQILLKAPLASMVRHSWTKFPEGGGGSGRKGSGTGAPPMRLLCAPSCGEEVLDSPKMQEKGQICQAFSDRAQDGPRPPLS